jgi:hypothetical protein
MLAHTVGSSEERRRHPRFDVSGLSGVLDGFRIFEALKLSVGGMLIRLPAELGLEQRVRIEIVLGEEVFRSRARVVFLGPDFATSSERSRAFRVGLAFLDPSPSDSAVVERYISETLSTRPLPRGPLTIGS